MTDRWGSSRMVLRRRSGSLRAMHAVSPGRTFAIGPARLRPVRLGPPRTSRNHPAQIPGQVGGGALVLERVVVTSRMEARPRFRLVATPQHLRERVARPCSQNRPRYARSYDQNVRPVLHAARALQVLGAQDATTRASTSTKHREPFIPAHRRALR